MLSRFFDMQSHLQPIGRCCGPGCRGGESAASFYDEKYFAWQHTLGEQKAKHTNWTRLLHINGSDTVLDYGAGTGAILSSLKGNGRRVAVEYNVHARRYMNTKHPSIATYQYPEQVPLKSIDVIMSTSVIEHVECPIQELRALRMALRDGGRVAIGIKNEGMELWRAWRSDNRDNHLYTWNSMLLGNLLRAAGFVVDRIQSQPPVSQYARLHEAAQNTSFGRFGPVFQYVWAFGHLPREGERWPQKGNAQLIRRR